MKDSWENIELCHYTKKKSNEELFINEDIIDSSSEDEFIVEEPLVMLDNIIMEKNEDNQQYEIIENKDINYYIKKIKNKCNQCSEYLDKKNMNSLIIHKKYELLLLLTIGSFACSLYNLYGKYMLLEDKYNVLINQISYMEFSIFC
jgi:hypothetical protein